MSRSEIKTDFFGNKYTQHYNDNGDKIGTSVAKESFTGTKFIQHYDNDDNEIGSSEFKEDWLGNEYVQHFDNKSEKSGFSEKREDILGNEYVQHFDNKSEKTGYSEKKEDWLGNKYNQTRGNSSQNWSNETSTTYSSSNDEGNCLGTLIGYGLVAAAVLWFAFAIALPLILINIGLIGFIAALVYKKYHKFLFSLAILGGIIIILDYNNGWSTKTLVENVAFFKGFIPAFYFINLSAGLLGAYFLIRNFFNERNPDESAKDEFSKRNLIIMGCLLLVGGLTVGGQKYFENAGGTRAAISKTETGVSNAAPNKTAGEILFTGSVGKLKANYSVSWNANGLLNGTYSYPTRPNVIYVLTGKDLGNGNIELTEYTGSSISANCYLSLNGNCYSGQMKNIDGRQFKMVMCKTDNGALNKNSSTVQIPIDNIFKAWAKLDLNFYMLQWDQNSSQLSKKFETRNYLEIKSRRQILFSRLSSVEVINYNIVKLTQESNVEATIIVKYSMNFNFKNGNKISELDTTEKYLLRYNSQESRWLIYQNFDYIE